MVRVVEDIEGVRPTVPSTDDGDISSIDAVLGRDSAERCDNGQRSRSRPQDSIAKDGVRRVGSPLTGGVETGQLDMAQVKP